MRETTGHPYPNESVGSILSTNVITAQVSDELKDILKSIADKSWDDIQYAYAVDAQDKLAGVVDLARFSKTDTSQRVSALMTSPSVVLHPHADQERAVVLAVKNDVTAIPVIDNNGLLLGAVTARKLIDIMHQEHLEDALLASGIRGHGSHILKLATSRYSEVIGSRAPWLVFGAVLGLGLGLITSLFEEALQQSVALAYFIPVIAYIANSVGTQTGTITVRALATLKINKAAYIIRELVVGSTLGAMLGAVGAAGAFLISRSIDIAAVVGLSLLAASTIASLLASMIPIAFKALGKDPAIASGPVATVLQDIISILVYFLFAVALL